MQSCSAFEKQSEATEPTHFIYLHLCADDGPRIFLNIEDYLYYNQGRKRNTRFFEVMEYLR